MDARKQKEAAQYINSIQESEKNKLLFTAAQHMDMLQDSVNALSKMTGGKTEHQIEYVKKKIIEVEEVVREAVEGLQSLKCDYSDDSS